MILGWLFQSSLHYSYSVAIYAVGLVLTVRALIRAVSSSTNNGAGCWRHHHVRRD